MPAAPYRDDGAEAAHPVLVEFIGNGKKEVIEIPRERFDRVCQIIAGQIDHGPLRVSVKPGGPTERGPVLNLSDPLWTIRHCCRYLRVSESTFLNIRADVTQGFPRSHGVNRRPRWLADEVKAWALNRPAAAFASVRLRAENLPPADEPVGVVTRPKRRRKPGG